MFIALSLLCILRVLLRLIFPYIESAPRISSPTITPTLACTTLACTPSRPLSPPLVSPTTTPPPPESHLTPTLLPQFLPIESPTLVCPLASFLLFFNGLFTLLYFQRFSPSHANTHFGASVPQPPASTPPESRPSTPTLACPTLVCPTIIFLDTPDTPDSRTPGTSVRREYSSSTPNTRTRTRTRTTASGFGASVFATTTDTSPITVRAPRMPSLPSLPRLASLPTLPQPPTLVCPTPPQPPTSPPRSPVPHASVPRGSYAPRSSIPLNELSDASLIRRYQTQLRRLAKRQASGTVSVDTPTPPPPESSPPTPPASPATHFGASVPSDPTPTLAFATLACTTKLCIAVCKMCKVIVSLPLVALKGIFNLSYFNFVPIPESFLSRFFYELFSQCAHIRQWCPPTTAFCFGERYLRCFTHYNFASSGCSVVAFDSDTYTLVHDPPSEHAFGSGLSEQFPFTDFHVFCAESFGSGDEERIINTCVD